MFYHLGLHFGQAHPCGPGNDLIVHQAHQWHLGPGEDQADSWQPQHHALLNVQGRGDCSGSLPGTADIITRSLIVRSLPFRFMMPFFTTKTLWGIYRNSHKLQIAEKYDRV